MSSGNSFRPKFETLELRDQPASINFYDLLISSYQAPPAEMSEGGGHLEVESWSWGESK
jgi:hypothetical protein